MDIPYLFTACAIAISLLAYINSRKLTANQGKSLELQFTQHEERQKAAALNQFDKLKNELSAQKSESERNSATVSLRLANIEKKFDNVEEMHTEVALIKQTSMHIMKSVETIQAQLLRQAENNSLLNNNNTPNQRRKAT